MIARRAVLLAFASTALRASTLHAQDGGRSYRIGMLETTPPRLNAANLKALREGLRERGYIEGKNLVIEYRSADGHVDRFTALARDLTEAKVDIIVTRGTPAAVAARNATATIPIVMASSGDPIGTGIVATLPRPGGNVTGLSALVGQLNPKRVEILRELVPAVTRIGLVINGANPVMVSEWEEAKTVVPALGLDLRLIDVRRPDDVQAQIEAGIRDGAQAFIVAIDSVTQNSANVIADVLARHRVPAIYAAREFVDAGGLISYGVDYPYLYRRAASYIDKLLKGAKPADLPVEQPVQFEMVVNLKAAKALGLTVPQTLLARADEILE